MAGNYAILQDRGVVAVRGADALPFLQNIVTTNVETVRMGTAAYGALLTPQGKILFDFVIHGGGDGYLLDTPRAAAPDLAKRLNFYRLRAKVEVADVSDAYRVVAAWGAELPPTGSLAPDPRLPELGFRGVVAGDAAEFEGWRRADHAAYRAHRVALGVPEGGVDFDFGDSFPHDADMDQLGGIDFSKGCYIGQEVVSRMEHRGTARRRIVLASAPVPLPVSGEPISIGGQPLGRLRSVAGRQGLAQVRIDRAKDAMDAGASIRAGDIPLTLHIPEWARFGWATSRSED